MSTQLHADQHLVSALACDFSLEILRQLKAEGMTTNEVVERLPGITHGAVHACLKNLWGAGLLFRFRSEVNDQWWANKKRIAEVAARLSECAALLPERDLEAITKLSRENVHLSRLARFFNVSYRIEILRAVQEQPATMMEILQRFLPKVSPSMLAGSLQTLEEYDLVFTKPTLARREVARTCAKEYNITWKGTVALEALNSSRPLRDIFEFVGPDGTSTC